MKKREWGRRMLAALLCAMQLICSVSATRSVPLENGVPVEITSPSAMLVEAETGTVIFEKNADERRPVASVTKLMTLLLVLEGLEEGTLKMEDQITVSANAAGQIGSQALLDAGSVYTLEQLLRSTIIASANDGAVALAEHMAGSEEEFVRLMNERAAELGLTDTLYVNCTGLPAPGHYTTARDVAALSCEVCKHPRYFDYSAIWMDTLTHPGGRTTDLTNTNRLVRFYDGCDGLKTGSAEESGYCLSCTAVKGDMRLIAVVLGCGASQTRFNEARAMLDYGFAGYKRVRLLNAGDHLGHSVAVRLGMQDEVEAVAGNGLSMLLRQGQEKLLTIEVELPDEIEAPVEKGQSIGLVRIRLGDRVVAKMPAVAAEMVGMPGLLMGFIRLLRNWR
ncbi:MAG: D-alanyl-D-alanine carboxypeptidase [Clostridiales bacterium]|nr:D-alanyl-D-alanine carboxypeptidase [Clostridiales bacterium]